MSSASASTASQRSQPAPLSDNATQPTSFPRPATAGSTLFDPRHTSQPQPPPVARFAISGIPDRQATTPTQLHTRTMDGKRHAASFQQLEKLGEGTYATVSCRAVPRLRPTPLIAC